MHATFRRGDSCSRHDVRDMENPSNPWLRFSIFQSRLLHLCRLQIASPAFRLHIVRMEPDSCDAVAFCIDDPACFSCSRVSASCHPDAIIRPIWPGITLFSSNEKKEKEKKSCCCFRMGQALHAPSSSTRRGCSTISPFLPNIGILDWLSVSIPTGFGPNCLPETVFCPLDIPLGRSSPV